MNKADAMNLIYKEYEAAVKKHSQMNLIYKEYEAAVKKHPQWPSDPIHAAAILNEESGELTQACLDYVYRGADGKAAVDEAIQCGAMALRFLVNVGSYNRESGQSNGARDE